MDNASADISESVKVYCRIRPPLRNEVTDSSGSSFKIDEQNSVISYRNSKDLTNSVKMTGIFGHALESGAGQTACGTEQEEIYRTVAKPIVDSALRGYSGTILAYGPTNSGKTHTMRGMDSSELELGVMPRCIKQLLEGKTSSDVIYMSYVQIYCELVTDLLSGCRSGSKMDDPSNPELDQVVPAQSQQQLYIREHNGKVFVQGVSRVLLTSLDDFFTVMRMGDQSRATASTNVNETSSRSHAVMIISISSTARSESTPSAVPAAEACKQTVVTEPTMHESTLMLVDLAGSERASATQQRNYMRGEEAKAINLSLSALGNCISALCDRKTHIPYRDSKLTRLLQSSLGGNARTAMIITLPPLNSIGVAENPDYSQYNEIVGALKFAARASRIEVVAKVLRYVDYEKLYQELQLKLDAIQDVEYAQKKEVLHKQMCISNLERENELLRAEIVEWKSKLAEAESMQRAPPAAETGLTFIENQNRSRRNSRAESPAATAVDLSAVATKHEAEIADLKTEHSRMVASLRRKEAGLVGDLTSATEDLQKERTNHLDTLKDLTASKKRARELETQMNARTSEHITDLTEKQNQIEDLEAQIVQLNGKILHRHTNMTDEDEEETVPKSKVLEMESLFMDAINRLSDRVNQLESAKAQAEMQAQHSGVETKRSQSASCNDWLNDDSGFSRPSANPVAGHQSSSSRTSGSLARSSGSTGNLRNITLNPHASKRVNAYPVHGGAGSSNARVGGGGSSFEPGKIRPNKIHI